MNDGLEIDSLALCGLLSLPWEVITISHQIEGDKPLHLIDAFKVALRDPDVLTLSRREGIRLQWKRLEAIYRREVDEFRASDAFQRTRWRQRSITRPQHYLIGQIHRLLSVPIPTLRTRGEAYDFISEHGGNPRFPVGQSIPHSQPRA